MKVHRFITPLALLGTEATINDPAVYHQAKRVLKLGIGEEIIITDGTKTERRIMIESFDNHVLRGRVVSTAINTREPEMQAHLCISLLKRENFEWVVQKATEVGVASIVPLVCERTIKLGMKAQRLELIAREAAEQCGRSTVPAIHEAVTFREWVTTMDRNAAHYFFDSDGRSLLRTSSRRLPVYGYIGPEGGWTMAERQLATDAGMQIATLGSLVLRAETAATIASYLMLERSV